MCDNIYVDIDNIDIDNNIDICDNIDADMVDNIDTNIVENSDADNGDTDNKFSVPILPPLWLQEENIETCLISMQNSTVLIVSCDKQLKKWRCHSAC